MKVNQEKTHITLKEAGKITGYAPDYIGFLIRKKKIKGEKKYLKSSWLIAPGEIIKYCQKHKTLEYREPFYLLRKKFLSLKEAAQLSGYATDYIGYLIRKRKIKGKRVYSGVSWVTTEEAIREYKQKQTGTEKQITTLALPTPIPFWKNNFQFSFKISKYGVVFVVFGIIIFSSLIAWAFSPKNPTQITEIYPIQINGNPEGIPAESYGASWQNPKNALGIPEVGPSGDINYFSETNSAIYKNGIASLIIQDFQQTEIRQEIKEKEQMPEAQIIEEEIIEEEIIIEGEIPEIEPLLIATSTDAEDTENIASSIGEATSTIIIIDEMIPEEEIATTTNDYSEEENINDDQTIINTELSSSSEATSTAGEVSLFEKIRKMFGGGTARAQQIPAFDELIQKDFQGAKIKFSFAVGEKEPDMQIIDGEETTGGEPDNTTSTEPVSFWNKYDSHFRWGPEISRFARNLKNFFVAVNVKIAQMIDNLVAKMVLIANAEESATPAPVLQQIQDGAGQATTIKMADGEDNEATTAIEIMNSELIVNETTTETTAINEGLIGGTSTIEIIEIDTMQTTTEEIIDETSTIEITSETTTNEVLPDPDAKIIIWYSLNGQGWQILDTISSCPLSNDLNGGYFTFDAPFLKDWEDIKNLKIKLEGVVGGESKVMAYLDSVWVEVEYREKEEKKDEEEFELKAVKKDWRADETPEFEVTLKGEKVKANIVRTLVAQISSIFEEKPKVRAMLIKPDDKRSPLLEGQDFNAVTHSPTKITIFKSEDFRPGFHTLKIDYEKDGKVYNLEQDFTWGVLGINVNKSIYLPGETAYLQMAVLSETGHTLFDADLTLEITAPDGTKTILKTSSTTAAQPGIMEEGNAGTDETAENTENPENNETAENLETSETIDTIIDSSPGKETTSDTVTFTFHSTLPSIEEKFSECKVNNFDWIPCESPKTYFNLAPGDYTFQVFVTDLRGRYDPTPAVFSWVITKRNASEPLPDANKETITQEIETQEESSTSTSETPSEDSAEDSSAEEEIATEEIIESTSTEAIQEATTSETTEFPGATSTAEDSDSATTPSEDSIENESLATSTLESESPLSFWQEMKNNFLISAVRAADTDDAVSDLSFGIIYRSGETDPKSVTNTPDYYAYYTVGGEGEYKLKLTAITENGTHEITDSFEVRESVLFDVERIGPTRIYPPATYEMILRIKSNQDFIGEVVETVPVSFKVTTDSPTQIRAAGSLRQIVWQVDWKAGEAHELKYIFDAPNISPYLYLLGPLEFYE